MKIVAMQNLPVERHWVGKGLDGKTVDVYRTMVVSTVAVQTELE